MMLEEVRKAKECILSGGVLLYPTDTIWGIGCDATHPDAVQKVYAIKQRSDQKSMLVLMNGISMLSKYLDQIPDKAVEIINAAKKPTTIIYPGATNLAKNLVAEDGSVGVRITRDPFCRKLLEELGKPIVSTSANLSGDPAPSTYKAIDARICEGVDLVVDWRRDEDTLPAPSTILRIDNKGEILVIRP